MKINIVVLGLFVLLAACSFNEPGTDAPIQTAKTVLTVPAGQAEGEVVYTLNGDPDREFERFGAESFAVTPDGQFCILNDSAKQVIIYKTNGFVRSVTYPEQYSALDIELVGGKLVLLLDSGDTLELNPTPVRAAGVLLAPGTLAADTLPVRLLKNAGALTIHTIGAGETASSATLSRSIIAADADVIGYDNAGNSYALATRKMDEVAGRLEIEQIVYKRDPAGTTIAAVRAYDSVDFITPRKNIYIREDGTVYQLCSDSMGIRILELEPNPDIAAVENAVTASLNAKAVKLRSLAARTVLSRALNSAGTQLTRDQMYTRASAIANLSWTFNSTLNKAKRSDVLLPKQLRTISGTRTMKGIPYNWGGWDSTSLYTSRMSSGYTAGNVNCTGGLKPGTAGVDCSGFVSRVWGTSSKLGTSMIIDQNWIYQRAHSSLVRMDILVKRGHVMFYLSSDSTGVVTLESTTGGTEQRAKQYYRTWKEVRDNGYIGGKYVNTIEVASTSGTIALTVPPNIIVGSTVTFKGTYTGDVRRVKRQITGSTLFDVGTVSGGTYSFPVTFTDSAGTREITVYGYDTAGKQLCKVVKTFTVNPQVSINYTIPAAIYATETATFKGTYTGNVATVKRQITGSTVRDVGAVSGGIFSFGVLFGAESGERELTVWGYDSSGREVCKVVKKFTVLRAAVDYAIPSTIKAGTTVTFKGTYRGDVTRIKRQITGSTLVDVGTVSGGAFSFPVLFGSTTGQREMTVYAYNAAGIQVAKIVKKYYVTN